MIWETSLKEIVGQNVELIVNEPIFQSILVRAVEFVKGKLDKTAGAKGISELPRTLATEVQDELDKGQRGEPMFADLEVVNFTPEQAAAPKQALTQEEQQYIEDEINKDYDIRTHVGAILASNVEPGSRGVQGAKVETSLMDDEIVEAMVPPESAAEDEKSRSIMGTILLGKRVVTVVGAVIWRYANGRDHRIYLTIVEEIMRAFYVRAAVRFLWTEMKDAVGRAFEPGPECGGQALVEQISKLWKTEKPCITLVGHSAGAIYVGRLLKELDAAMPQDFQANVVLIAPACTFDYLADAFEKAGKRVANLRIFGMSDPVERDDHLVRAIYPASLLYFVSGVLEDDRDEPLAGMQRYYFANHYGANFKTVADVKAFPYLVRPHAFAWSHIAGFPGANCDMVKHGGWADAPATLESIRLLIQGGCSNAW